MGRRTTKTTKSGKYINPTDQWRKQQRRKELKKNKKQRQTVRDAVIRSKDPRDLLLEIEDIEKQETDLGVDALNEKGLAEKKKKLHTTLARVMGYWQKEDPKRAYDIKELVLDSEKKRREQLQVYDSYREARDQYDISDIPMPDSMPLQSAGSTVQVSTCDIPMPPDEDPAEEDSDDSSDEGNLKPPGPPPGPPPTFLFSSDNSEGEEEEEDEDTAAASLRPPGPPPGPPPAPPTTTATGTTGPESDQHAARKRGEGSKYRNVRFADKASSDSGSEDSGAEDDNAEEGDKDKGTRELVPPGPPPGPPPSVMPPHLMPPGPPPPLFGQQFPPRPLGMPPGPPPGMPPPPNRPPPMAGRPGFSMGPPRPLFPPNPNQPHIQSQAVLSVPEKIQANMMAPVPSKPKGPVISAGPQLRNIQAEVTKFMPTSLRVRRDHKLSSKSAKLKAGQSASIAPPPLPPPLASAAGRNRPSAMQGDAYESFMKEMQGLL